MPNYSMILFVVDQVAGAEYIYPLLRKWKERGFAKWSVACSPVSARFLKEKLIDCIELPQPTISDVSNVLDASNPQKAVLSSSGESVLEGLFLSELKKRNIPSHQFIDNWVNYAARFEKRNDRGEVVRSYPDVIFTIDKKARDEMTSVNIPEDIIEIVGQPYFEYSLQTQKDVGASGLTSLLLITQPISRYYGQSLGYDEVSFISACLDAWRPLKNAWSSVDILIHPAEDTEPYREITASYSKEIRLLRTADCDLRKYAIVIGMFSSMLVQSILAGIETISFQPNASGEDLCCLSRHGYIERIVTKDGMRDLLQDYKDFRRLSENACIGLRSSIEGSCDRFERAILSYTSMEAANE